MQFHSIVFLFFSCMENTIESTKRFNEGNYSHQKKVMTEN